MPENEFEKKVSSELHELKLKPSEQVWPKVEERIRKKKDRRVFIIIFLFAGLVLLGYWQWNNLSGKKKNEIIKTETPGNNSNTQPKQETEVKKTIQPQINRESQLKNENSKLTQTQKKSNDNRQQEINDKYTLQKNQKIVAKNLTVEKKEKKASSVANSKIAFNKAEKKQNTSNQNSTTKTKKEEAVLNPVNDDQMVAKPNDKKEIKQEDTQEQIKQEGTAVKPTENKIDSAKTEVVEQKVTGESKNDTASKVEPVKEDSVAAVVKKQPLQKKWKWGLHFTPGISSLNDQNFSLGTMMAADLNYQSPVGSTGNPPPPPPADPSEHKAGFAFKLGGFMQGQISKKSQLVFGLQYAYYSEQIKVGNQTGSPAVSLNSSFADANSYYRAANAYQDITNSYHFLEGSVDYQFRLNKNQAKPFTWNVGFNLGQLIATNAVMYDTASGGIYYKNTDYLNKTQFSLSTGFSWTFMNNQRTQWTLGPAIDIHFNSLLDNPFESTKYLFFAGLRSACIFNSKK